MTTRIPLAPATEPTLQRIEARPSEVGGIVLRRALPNRALRTVGAWCFLDHAGPAQFGPGQGMHVGPHRTSACRPSPG